MNTKSIDHAGAHAWAESWESARHVSCECSRCGLKIRGPQSEVYRVLWRLDEVGCSAEVSPSGARDLVDEVLEARP